MRLLRLQRTVNRKTASLFVQFRRAEHIFMVTSAIIIGVVGAFAAIVFRHILNLFQSFYFSPSNSPIYTLQSLEWWQKLLVPALGGLIAGLIARYIAKEVRGSGIPEVMEAVAVKGGRIRIRVILAKVLAAASTIASGGSAGREGPIVQIGSAIASGFGQLLGVGAKRLRTFVACGAASAIAATFNAPIAGALFAMEIVIGNFAVTQFSPVVISSVVATVLSRHYLGNSPAFEIPAYEIISSYEFIPYTILGILAGITAVAFIKSLEKSGELFSTIPLPAWARPALGGFLTGVVALFLPQVFGVGYDVITNALWSEGYLVLLILLIPAKIIATSFTLGSGGSGGIFAPALFIGAMLGCAVGIQANAVHPTLTADPGAYALVGMGALVAGATHAPVSAILIIFELTNDYHIIPPLMVSCILSLLISVYLKKESVYTYRLQQKGLNIFEGKDINLLRSLTVSDVLGTDIEKLPGNSSFPELIRRLIQSPHQEFFVVDSQDEMIGVISVVELKQFLKQEEQLSGLVIAADLAHPPPAYLYLDDSLDLVMHNFGRFNVDELPVLESHSCRRLAGSVQRQHVIDAYNREIFKWDLAGGMHSVVTAVSEDRMIELDEGYSMMEIDPPDGFVGKTLKTLNVRSRYGIEVILIRTAVRSDSSLPSRPGMMPNPDYVIQSGDRLLVMGSKKSLEYLK